MSDLQLTQDISFFRECSWWPNGRSTRIHMDQGGHEREIVVNIERFGHGTPEGYIDPIISDLLSELLPYWLIKNRGSRIECHPTGCFAGGFRASDKTPLWEALITLGLSPEA